MPDHAADSSPGRRHASPSSPAFVFVLDTYVSVWCAVFSSSLPKWRQEGHRRASVALKVLSKHKLLRSGLAGNVRREICAMRRLCHPNILRLLDVLASRSRIYLVLELAKGGELFSRLAGRGRLTEDVARPIFHQLLSAVAYAHVHGVFHRDLKPENLLLLDDSPHPRLKVSDFGLAAIADQLLVLPHRHLPDRSPPLFHTICGTPAYVAPEVLSCRPYDAAKADLWSCGVVLFVLVAGYLPFNDPNLMALYRKICRAEFRCPRWVSRDLPPHLARLLDPDPAARISAAEIVHEPWFRKGLDADRFAAVTRPHRHDLDGRIASKIGDGGSDEDRNGGLNAFDLIALSPSLDLSGFFAGLELATPLPWRERFISGDSPEETLARVEAAVAGEEGMTVRRLGNAGLAGAALEGPVGELVVLVVLRRLNRELVMVEMETGVGDGNGDFLGERLRPALGGSVGEPDSRGSGSTGAEPDLVLFDEPDESSIALHRAAAEHPIDYACGIAEIVWGLRPYEQTFAAARASIYQVHDVFRRLHGSKTNLAALCRFQVSKGTVGVSLLFRFMDHVAPPRTSTSSSGSGFNFSKLCKRRSVTVPSYNDNPKPNYRSSSAEAGTGNGPDDNRDGKVHPQPPEEPLTRVSKCSEEAVILKLFDAITALKCAYVQLQQAHLPYEPKKIKMADDVMVSLLGTLSSLQEAHSSRSALHSQIQDCRGVLAQLQSKARIKDSEIRRLRWEMEESETENAALEKMVRQTEKVVVLFDPNWEATPALFSRVCRSTARSFHDFAKPLISMMKASGWDLDRAVSSLDDSLSFAQRVHKKYALEAYLCRVMLGTAPEDESDDGFGMDQLDRVMTSQDPFDAVMEDPNGWFGRFCRARYALAVPSEMERSFFGNLDQRSFVTSGGHPRTPFYEAFVRMARWAWALQVMANSFIPKAEMFYAKKGHDFSGDFMESVADGVMCEEGGETLEVGFTVTPGFRIGSTIRTSFSCPFLFSDMMPSAWFYKLKDMSHRGNKNHGAPHSTGSGLGVPSKTAAAATPKPFPPAETNLLPNRASCYYPNRTEAERFSFSPTHSKAVDTHFPVEPPRQSKKKGRKKPLRSPTKPKLVASSVSAGCSCRAARKTESSPEFPMVASLEAPPPYPLDYYVDVEDPEFQKTNYSDDDGFEYNNLASWQHSKAGAGPRIRLGLGAQTPSDHHKSWMKESEDNDVDDKVGIGHNVGLGPPQQEVRGVDHDIGGGNEAEDGLIGELCGGEVVVGPAEDFRDSMLEMIVENNIRASKDLEELLACYLSLNSDEYHDAIVKAFQQIWFDLCRSIKP
ncbi:hypothetical protein MUK42_03743 [Musa troglodytarum]|uniref:non-specific serine/threonine protein kinase n=1 Tax=Musa troglodytarum TaxID=320322 RepID=A0A9E7K2M7_9LILI|nr:hypothetical protein MUK42_03743 [Musa troglodytarum]